MFDELFDADGASISVNPIESYATLGEAIEFAQLVGTGKAIGGPVIGYSTLAGSKHLASWGVKLNPAKTTKFTSAKGDELIVVGELNKIK